MLRQSTLLTAAIEDSDSDYTESTIALSASFLSNRGLSNRTWKDFVRFKVVDVPELCEVVLAGLSCESYESAVNDLSDAYRGFKESNFGIVSVGSILSVTNSSTPYRYKILNANPVFQGLISEQTKLTIIRGDTPHNLSDVDSVDTDDDNVDTDDLLSSSEGEEQEDLKFIDIQPCGKKEALFNAKTLADAIPQSLLYILNSYFDYSDSCIYATPFGLLRIGAFNGSLVRVKTKHDERIVRIRALQAARISRSMSSKSIFVPPILYHNLGRPSATYISIIEESAVSKAVAARIARLPTPDTNKSSVYELAVDSLKQWISAEPRMVKEGDLIMVTVDKNHAKGLKMSKDQSRIVQDNEDNEEKDPTLVISAPENAKSIIPAYFTVTELAIKQPNLTNTYLLDIGFTNIIQAAVSHTLLPSADVIAACYPLKGMTPSSSDLECIQQIRKILSTCLHPLAQKMESGTSVLIHGPPGCGKRYILKQVCSDVGIKYYEINASDLLADNQSKFAQNLQSKLDYAAELAPCVLLIRNFEMIKKKTGLADTEIQGILSTSYLDCYICADTS
ncbi:hypothetical protein BKA69DRAFT_799272 [Paraphysoderma sedebokerense]|nr:hypothetical protein BKA69DRAFT_799272 [Paraphysoderma sedebokerense]